MARPAGIVIDSKAKRERLSKRAPLRFQLVVSDADMQSLLEALHDLCARDVQDRTLNGLVAELALYERLHRMALGCPPESKLCDVLQAQFGPGEWSRVLGEAKQRWTV
jgi:hypothetical protein